MLADGDDLLGWSWMRSVCKCDCMVDGRSKGSHLVGRSLRVGSDDVGWSSEVVGGSGWLRCGRMGGCE